MRSTSPLATLSTAGCPPKRSYNDFSVFAVCANDTPLNRTPTRTAQATPFCINNPLEHGFDPLVILKVWLGAKKDASTLQYRDTILQPRFTPGEPCACARLWRL